MISSTLVKISVQIKIPVNFWSPPGQRGRGYHHTTIFQVSLLKLHIIIHVSLSDFIVKSIFYRFMQQNIILSHQYQQYVRIISNRMHWIFLNLHPDDVEKNIWENKHEREKKKKIEKKDSHTRVWKIRIITILVSVQSWNLKS